MSRRRLIAVAGLAAACVVALVLVAMLGGGGDDAPAPRDDVAISTSLAPNPLFFGDLVTARAQVLVNRRELDPDTVLLEATFAPFSLVGRPQESRTSSGQTTSIDVRYTLQCLVEACLPQPGGITLPKLLVHTRPSSDNLVTYNHGWPRVDVVSRVAPAALATDPPPWRQQVALPAVSYRLEPGKLAAALTLAAALLVLGAFALVVERSRDAAGCCSSGALPVGARTRARARARLGRAWPGRPSQGACAARTRARLRPERRPAPRVRAARLAWGRSEPSATGLESLVDEIEKTVRVRVTPRRDSVRRCAQPAPARAAHHARAHGGGHRARRARGRRRAARAAPEVRESTVLPKRSNGIVVLDLSASISPDTYARIGATLRELHRVGRPVRPRRLL